MIFEHNFVDISIEFVIGIEEIIRFEAASGIKPNYRTLMHFIPIIVPFGVCCNSIVRLLLILGPCIVIPSLVALGLSPIVFVGEVSLRTLI